MNPHHIRFGMMTRLDTLGENPKKNGNSPGGTISNVKGVGCFTTPSIVLATSSVSVL